MQKTAILTTIGLLAIALASPLGAADHGCNGAITAIDAGGETLYLDDRSTGAGEINHWFYLESNGAAGLQTGGDNAVLEDNLLFTFTDPCDHGNPDVLLL